MRRNVAIFAVAVSGAACVATQAAAPAVSHADEVICPVGMYWDVYSMQCLYFDATIYIDPLHPVLGPVGPIGVGGVIGPVGPGPVGPGPVGPGPVGPGGLGRR